MTRIDYDFLDGHFERVPFKKLSKRIARELLKLERRDERALERDCRYLHGDGYVEGDSEFQMREINYSDPVADMLDTAIRETALRDALGRLNPTQRKRLWLYAQGHTATDIARLEGVSDMAVRKSIKLGKKKIKNILKNGFGLSADLWGYK